MEPLVSPVAPCDLVIFGATGDLARRKILPALYQRTVAGQIPPEARIIGAARGTMDIAGFRTLAQAAIAKFVHPKPQDEAKIAIFLQQLHFVPVDAVGETGWEELVALLDQAEERIRVFYLSVAPALFGPLAMRLANAGFDKPGNRIVIEKPVGRDLASARDLNHTLSSCFDETQIYRIDHYLGKEAVQNLMALRFANALFEPLWNSRYIDHVQITVAETIGIGGRGEYYDQSGAMRDMVQNHLMQLLCLTAMEPPGHFDPDDVRDEKLKVIKALQPVDVAGICADTVRGQYGAGPDGPAYTEEAGNDGSRTESFVALKVRVDNWRWAGTPFYLRTGKRLGARLSEIAVVFKETPHSIFPPEAGGYGGNTLLIRLQPDEGITLGMTIKKPGPAGMHLIDVPLDMSCIGRDGGAGAPTASEAYERLIMDVIRGDQTLFMRGDEVEAAWAWAELVLQTWDETGQAPQTYEPGTAGPADAHRLMQRDGRKWRELSA